MLTSQGKPLALPGKLRALIYRDYGIADESGAWYLNKGYKSSNRLSPSAGFISHVSVPSRISPTHFLHSRFEQGQSRTCPANENGFR